MGHIVDSIKYFDYANIIEDVNWHVLGMSDNLNEEFVVEMAYYLNGYHVLVKNKSFSVSNVQYIERVSLFMINAAALILGIKNEYKFI